MLPPQWSCGDQSGRQFPGRLARGVTGEAEVDDCDLRAGAGRAHCVPGARRRRDDSLALDSQRNCVHRCANSRDAVRAESASSPAAGTSASIRPPAADSTVPPAAVIAACAPAPDVSTTTRTRLFAVSSPLRRPSEAPGVGPAAATLSRRESSREFLSIPFGRTNDSPGAAPTVPRARNRRGSRRTRPATPGSRATPQDASNSGASSVFPSTADVAGADEAAALGPHAEMPSVIVGKDHPFQL